MEYDLDAPIDAGELVGLLAERDRRAVFAALVLGADTLAEVRRATGIDARGATRAIHRLVEGGLVIEGADGTLVLLAESFTIAARAAAAARASAPRGIDGADDLDRAAAKVLRTFVQDGRLVQIPAQHAKRLVILEWLSQEFEPGRRYSEAMVNLVLGRFHADTAALRRYLVDEGFLDRDAGEYWRSGGPVHVD